MTSIEALQANSQKIAAIWLDFQQQDAGDFADEQSAEYKEEINELVDAFTNALSEKSLGDVNAREFDKVHDIVGGMAISRARQGFSPRETSTFLMRFKEALLQVLSQEISDARQLYADSLKISNIIDNMVVNSFEAYIKGREEIIMRQTDEIAEISTPVIRVWEGVLALPIIGTLDSSRTQIVMESLLQNIVETESPIAILDISGVPAVDTLVAQHLIKTVNATRLMGAECIISGIRPEIAQTIVHLGIDLSGILTKATLASALQEAFKMMRVNVTKSDPKKAFHG